jgi:hypothetical protein
MNPRYFVTYKNLRSGQSDPIEVSFGRFFDQDAATRRAKEAYDVEGYGELISVRPETSSEARIYRVSRFFVRLFRIVFASLIALFVFAWLSDHSTIIGDIPFSNLTLNMVLSSLFKVAVGIGTACLCWYIAFSDGPDH